MREGNKHFNVLIYLSDFRRNESNLMSTNINSTTIIKILNSNLKSNMKDINKTLAKKHFKCKYKENNAKKQHIFVEIYLSKDLGSLFVISSLFPPVLRGRSRLPIIGKCGEPWEIIQSFFVICYTI